MKNEYTISKALWTKWTWESTFVGKQLGLFIMWCVLAATGLGIGIYMSSKPDKTPDKIADIVIVFLLCAVCLYRAFLNNILIGGKQYKLFAKTFGSREWKRTILFNPNEILITEGTSNMTYKYTDIVDIVEKKNEAWLVLSNKKRIRLYLDCFKNTNWAECRNLIENKRKPGETVS